LAEGEKRGRVQPLPSSQREEKESIGKRRKGEKGKRAGSITLNSTPTQRGREREEKILIGEGRG